MKLFGILIRCFVLVSVLNLIFIQTPFSINQAAIIGTQTTLSKKTITDKSAITAFINRKDVQKAMVAQGINPIEAKARIANLTNNEIQKLNGLLGELPAGGIDIISTAVFVFLVFLITDLLGATDLFPFVKPL